MAERSVGSLHCEQFSKRKFASVRYQAESQVCVHDRIKRPPRVLAEGVSAIFIFRPVPRCFYNRVTQRVNCELPVLRRPVPFRIIPLFLGSGKESVQYGGRSKTKGQAPREEAEPGLRAQGYEARPLLRRQRTFPESRSIGCQAMGAEAGHPRAATHTWAGRMRARLPRRSARGCIGEPQDCARRWRSSRATPPHDQYPFRRGSRRNRHRASPARLAKREACSPVGSHSSRLRVPAPGQAIRR